MTSDLPPIVEFGPFRFHPTNGLWRDGVEVALPPRALGILEALTARAGEVVSKQRLMDAVWKDACVTEASLLEAIRVLREALGDDRLNPTYIQTVHRRGYRFIAPVQATVRLGPVAPPAPGPGTRAPISLPALGAPGGRNAPGGSGGSDSP